LTLRSILKELENTQRPHQQDRFFGDDFNALLDLISTREPVNTAHH